MGRLEFLYRSELPHRAIAVYMYLDDRANKEGTCYPAIPTIAGDTGLSQSTVRRALEDLRKEGLLTSRKRYRKNGGDSANLYTLIRPE